MMLTQRNRSKSKELLRNFRNRSFHRLQEDEEELQQASVSPSISNEDQVEGLRKRIMDFQFRAGNRPVEEESVDPNAKRIAEFIYALYGKQAKENKSLVHRINGVCKRTFAENDVDRKVRRAEKLKKTVSASCCPDGVLELTRLDVYELRGELETMIKRVLDLISAYDAETQSVRVAKATNRLIEQWNKVIPSFDGMFLHGYGVIDKDQVKLDVTKFVNALKIAQKFNTVPKEITAFKDVHFERVVATSNRFYVTLTARQQQPVNVWRYSLPA